ncbi:hypothetical protein [Streptomyces sp. TE33382]
MPLAYLPGGATRIRVKAVGDLDLTRITEAAHTAVNGTARATGAAAHA